MLQKVFLTGPFYTLTIKCLCGIHIIYEKEHKHEKDNKAGEMNISFSATEHVLRAQHAVKIPL